MPYQEDKLDILVVAKVAVTSKPGDQSLNQPTGPPVEAFTTTVSNFLGCLVEETITEAGTLSSVGIEKRYSKRGGGGRTPVEVAHSETTEESSVCYFSCHSPENPDTLYLKVVGIPSSPKRTITKNIDF